MKRKSFFLFALLVMLSVTGCSGGKGSETIMPVKLTVFAAASLTESFTQLAADFEQQESGKIKVILNFAGSQALRTSIEAGAQSDIFASADTRNMAMLKNKGFVKEYSIFVKNRLTLVENTSCKYTVTDISDLSAEGLKIAVADKSVPVGAYWEKALEKAAADGLISEAQMGSINKNIVTRELNVKDVLSKVLLNEVDLGIVYSTDAISADKSKIREAAIPFFGQFTASYPIAIMDAAKDKKSAAGFYNYILSDKGRELLSKYGFITE